MRARGRVGLLAAVFAFLFAATTPLHIAAQPLSVPASQEPKPPVAEQANRGRDVAATVLTAAAIALLIVQASRDSYHASGRPCACPDDMTRAGRRCGGNSAYSRGGGAKPFCFADDVSADMIERYRAKLTGAAAR